MADKIILPPSQQPKGAFCALLGTSPVIQAGNTVNVALTPCLESMCKFYYKNKKSKETCLLKLFFISQLNLPETEHETDIKN